MSTASNDRCPRLVDRPGVALSQSGAGARLYVVDQQFPWVVDGLALPRNDSLQALQGTASL